MSLLESLIEENPGIENSARGDIVTRILATKAAPTVTLAEAAICKFREECDIKQFYWEYIEFIESKYSLDKDAAVIEADKLLGYASAAHPENRDAWFKVLPDITHPIFGRKSFPPKGNIMSDIEITLNDSQLVERVEAFLGDLTPGFLMGNISYETVSYDPAVIRLSFSGHVGESEQYIAILSGLIDTIGERIRKETGHKLEYALRWKAKKVGDKKEDTQHYWEERLQYTRLGNKWFRKELRRTPTEQDAWVEEAYIGQYPTSCMDGTAAPYGLHLKFNLSEECVGSGTGVMVGWSFLGSQKEDFLKTCGVKSPEELKSKKLKIYEVGMMIVGVEAYREC